MMDCRTARQLLDFARPLHAELEKVELQELETHLAECPECGPLARAERQADQHLGKAMRSVPVPKGLHDRLSAQLGRERRGWNRKRQRVVAILSAAAAILLVIGVGLLWPSKPIYVPVERIGDEIWIMTTNPRPESIEAAFQSKGIKTVAPGDINYDLLHYYGVVNLQGKDVPCLFFTDGKNDAQVYVLPVKVFDVAEAYANQQGMGSGWKAEIRYDPTREYGYLIIYTGEPVKLFPKKSVGPET
jgi:hypothetical protein